VIGSNRVVGKLVWLGVLAAALALPLAAEEITVTIPPDDPSAQAEAAAPQAQAAPQPEAQPAHSAALPSYSPVEPLQQSADSSDVASPPPAAAPPAQPNKKAAEAPADVSPGHTAAEAPAAPAKPAQKPKKTASPCLNLDENACAGNTQCIWVAAGTNDAGKPTKARCRSLAMLKKEEERGKAKAKAAAAHDAKSAAPEVLPWATNGAAATPPAEVAPAATTDTTKPVKKAAVAKKAAKPKPEEAPAPPVITGQDGDASAGSEPAAQ